MEKSTIPVNRLTRDLSRQLKSGEWDEFVLALLIQADLDAEPFDDDASFEEKVRAVATRHDLSATDVDTENATLREFFATVTGSTEASMDAPLTG